MADPAPRFLSLATAPFGDGPVRDHEPVRLYDGETPGLPDYDLCLSEPFCVKTSDDDPVWKGRWVSNIRHKVR